MMRRELILKSIVTIAIAVVLLSAAPAKADLLYTTDDGLVAYQAGITTLSNAPDYEWWYGCSPTSAGMMMGYYDRNGFDNLVPGGTAELSNYGSPGALANQIIASSGHIADFWKGYGQSGNDPLGSGRTIPDDFDCLADFMGTSQDGMSVTGIGSWDNSDGSTTFWYFNDGSPMHASDIEYYETHGYAGMIESSGMYGIGEYVSYAGYDTTTLYNQYIDTLGLSDGFSFADYKAEIDAGRTVMIHTENHTMFGYGYDDSGASDLIYINDTWTAAEHTMIWGGEYGGVDHIGVTVMTIVPVPAAVLLGILGLGVVGIKLRKFA
jgi:hypothetical protein